MKNQRQITENSENTFLITLLGAILVSKDCDADDVAEVTANALEKKLNVIEELKKAFY